MDDTELRWDRFDGEAWKVSDPRCASTDPAAVVAYVERHPDGRCEVVWLCGGRGVEEFVSLAEARAAVVRRFRSVGRPTAIKPVPIAHRPPLSA